MISSILKIASSGASLQIYRLRCIAENLANANSQANNPFDNPYQRKIPIVGASFDQLTQTYLPISNGFVKDQRAFNIKYDPEAPGADEKGYVKLANVNPLIEISDMREATISYEANIKTYENEQARLRATIGLLG